MRTKDKKSKWLPCLFLLLLPYICAMQGFGEGVVLFQDDFNDGNANGWTQVSGTWSVVSPAYVYQGVGGDAEPTSGWQQTDYFVECKMKTVTGGTNDWNVGWIVVRYTDMDNCYYVLLKKGSSLGVLELSGRKTGIGQFAIASPNISLDPADEHTFKIEVEGTNPVYIRV